MGDGPLRPPQCGGVVSPVPLLTGLTTDTPINQGLGHAPENPNLLFPGAGRSGNVPRVSLVHPVPAAQLELSFCSPPQTESFSHPHQTLTKHSPSVPL